MKILLLLLAISVCSEGTINLGSLLGLLEPLSRNFPVEGPPIGPGYASYYRRVPPPAHPGYASYYRQAPAPAPVAVQPGYASYYRHTPAPAPAPAHVQSGYASYYRQAPIPAQPAPIVRVIQPIVYVPRPPPATASYYRHSAPPAKSNVVLSPAVHTAAPIVSSTFTVEEPFTHVKTHQEAAPKTDFSIVPSQSFSFSYSDAVDSDAQVQSLPQPTKAEPFNPSHSVRSDYTVEMVKSEGHSYALPEERITVEKTIAPVSNIEVHSQSSPVQNLKIDIRGPKALDEKPVEIVPSVSGPTAVIESEESAKSSDDAVQSVSFSGPIVVEPAVETSTAATPESVQAEPVNQPIASVTLDQEDITQQILRQAIPDVINKVSPAIIQQAIPLIIDRAVPQIVYQVGQQQRQQAENVQIVTPFNHQQHQQQKEDEKVFVMYATSVPQEPSQVSFEQRGQFDDSENLVIPIGNRNQFNAQAQGGQKIVFEKGIDVGGHVEEEHRSVENVNQQIISSFQRENLAYQQERSAANSASSFSGARAQQGGFASGASSFSRAGTF